MAPNSELLVGGGTAEAHSRGAEVEVEGTASKSTADQGTRSGRDTITVSGTSEDSARTTATTTFTLTVN